MWTPPCNEFSFYIFHNNIRKYLQKSIYLPTFIYSHLPGQWEPNFGAPAQGRDERNDLWPRRLTAHLFLLGFRGLCREDTEDVVLCYPPSIWATTSLMRNDKNDPRRALATQSDPKVMLPKTFMRINGHVNAETYSKSVHDRQCTYKSNNVSVTTFALEIRKYYMFGVFSGAVVLQHAIRMHVPYYTVICGVSSSTTFFHVIS